MDAWLTKKMPNLNYRIGFDYTGEMKQLWMDRSFSVGIPTLFVVDRDGHIAFIGSWKQLDDVFPRILTGTWRTSDEAEAADAERIAKGNPASNLRPPWMPAIGVRRFRRSKSSSL